MSTRRYRTYLELKPPNELIHVSKCPTFFAIVGIQKWTVCSASFSFSTCCQPFWNILTLLWLKAPRKELLKLIKGFNGWCASTRKGTRSESFDKVFHREKTQNNYHKLNLKNFDLVKNINAQHKILKKPIITETLTKTEIISLSFWCLRYYGSF